MKTSRAAAFVAGMALCFAPLSARAGESHFEVDLLAGAAFSSRDAGFSTSSVDEFGTTTSNAFRSEGKAGLSYGARLRYVSRIGLGVEVIYERADLKLDSTTRYDLAWQSVTGSNAESYQLSDSGKLKVNPLSLDLLYRADVLPWMGVTVSGGITYEKIDLDDSARVGLVTYVGDSIETFVAATQQTKSDSRTTWNAGLDLDFRIAPWASIFVDGRYYGNARGTAEPRHVIPGTYAGLHLGGTVAVDAQSAALYDAQIAASTAEIDTKMVRAAMGIRFRF